MIATLTINPALDTNTHVTGMVPEKKLRCTAPDYFAGGGGINVSRALARLHTSSLPLYASGGPAGKKIGELLENEKIKPQPIEVTTWTRDNLTVKDDASGNQFRFTFPGYPLTDADQTSIYSAIEFLSPFPKFLVLSGSFAPDFPLNFIEKLKDLCDRNLAKLIVDTSGPYLSEAVNAGVYLIKPNYQELCELAGIQCDDLHDIEPIARKVIKDSGVECMLISLGANGASWITKNEYYHIHAPKVPVKSTVGAGDSMLAGVVHALAKGYASKEVLKWGVACGTATTMNEGTGLFQFEQVETILRLIK